MGINHTFRASTRAGSQNQLVYWALAVAAAAVVVWMWWGHRKDARVVQKPKSVTPQKIPAPAVAAPYALPKSFHPHRLFPPIYPRKW